MAAIVIDVIIVVALDEK